MGIRVYVDWENNRNFTGTYDDISADIMGVSWSLGSRNAYQHVCDESTADIVVRNTDGKYTPENSASVIFGKIRPNRRIRISDDVTGVELWNGYLDISATDWQPKGPALTGKHTVTLKGVGAKQALQRVEVPMKTYENVTVDVIIADVLRKAGIFMPLARGWFLGVAGFSELGVSTYLLGSGVWGDFETGISVIPRYGDEVKNVLAIIAELVETERGRFFFDRLGRFVLHNRHHVYTLVDDVTLTDARLTAHEYEFGVGIINSVQVDGNPRRVVASETLWELDAPMTIGVGQVARFESRLRRANGQFAGSGALTPTANFSSGRATVTVTPRGGLATISIDNTDGTIPAVLETLTVAGAPQYSQNAIKVFREDEPSVQEFGRLQMAIKAGVTGDYDSALAIAQTELAKRGLRGVVKSISMRNIWDGVQNAYMLTGIKIGDFVGLTIGSTNHEGRYIVIGEQHSWMPGKIHDATFYLEPLPVTPNAFTLDVSNLDEDYLIF